MTGSPHTSQTKLLDATLKVVRTKGYHAARIGDICSAAGVTKGSFFHHFDSKDDLALAAAAHWREHVSDTFANAAYNTVSDPLDQLLAYLEFRKSLLKGALPDITCFAGTVIQETYVTHPQLRDACGQSIEEHVGSLARIVGAALRQYGVKSDWTAESLALHMQAVIQGAFILAKAQGQAKVAADCIDHLRRYLELLFGSQGTRP
jgi:TetR/AcrR family transcriptional regulator, transcriptional repressor for nem operon